MEQNKHLNTNVVKEDAKINIQKDASNSYIPKQTVAEEPINNPNNPYAQQVQAQQQQAERKKEGPIKKPKIQPAGQKQKINIYEQAEEAEGLNEFVNEPKK